MWPMTILRLLSKSTPGGCSTGVGFLVKRGHKRKIQFGNLNPAIVQLRHNKMTAAVQSRTISVLELADTRAPCPKLSQEFSVQIESQNAVIELIDNETLASTQRNSARSISPSPTPLVPN